MKTASARQTSPLPPATPPARHAVVAADLYDIETAVRQRRAEEAAQRREQERLREERLRRERLRREAARARRYHD